MRILLASAVFLSALVGCSPKKEYDREAVRAEHLVGLSFSVTTPITVTKDKAQVVIQKSALEKEFLLNAETITQLGAPNFKNQKSRIVAFRLRAGKLYLLEATKGHTLTEDMPQSIILAEFDIVRDSSDSIVFDFNSGFDQVLAAADWQASDFSGRSYTPSFNTIDLVNAHIADAYISESNKLVIRQVGMARQSYLQNYNTPVEIRYYIAPYIENPSYEPLPTTDFERYGFFEVSPQYRERGGTSVYATRFDPAKEKPIVYAVSPNTPEEYRNAVKEGVLYWNRAFGYEKVKVVDAPEGVSAPHPDYNIVQWVNFDDAGFAYADAQMDPRTGEIQHAQVFMTSAFGFGGKNLARRLLRASSEPQPKAEVALPNFESGRLCDFAEHESLVEAVKEILSQNLSEEAILKIAQDYVREVVAHEIGHTLGLRHNFAGNLGATVGAGQVRDLFNKYLKEPAAEISERFSSSVMEYQAFPSSAMSGQLMIQDGVVFSYDKKAIDVLYHGGNPAATDGPLFCTDSHSGVYLGCTQWDEGRSVIEDAVVAVDQKLKDVPVTLMERIIQAKTPGFGVTPKSVSEISLSVEADAARIYSSRGTILKYLVEGSRDLRAYRSVPKVDSLNKKAVEEKQAASAHAELMSLGGLVTVMAPVSKTQAEVWMADFEALIDSPYYQKGVGYDGSEYQLSTEEIAEAKEIAALYFTELEKALHKAELKSLKVSGDLVDHEAADALANLYLLRGQTYMASQTGEVLREQLSLGDNKSVTVHLPVYEYDKETRVLAASLFVGTNNADKLWGINEFHQLKSSYNEEIKKVLGDNELSSVKLEQISKRARKWLLEVKAVKNKLAERF